MTDALVADSIFLLGESESGKRSGAEVDFGAREEVECAGADPKLEVAQAKDVATPTCGVAQVFARTEKEIKSGNETLGRGEGERGVLTVREGPHLRHNRQR